MSSPNRKGQDTVPISQLSPLTPESSSIQGIVTLIWPYSSSQQSFSFLLVDPDFRLRREKGQARVIFKGPCAHALATAGINSGDEVQLSLLGVSWVKNGAAIQLPGKSIEWELHFEQRLVLRVCSM